DEDGSKTRKSAPAPTGAKPASDVLELTEMVNDDGSVTSLENKVPPPMRPLDEDEPPIYADRGNDRSEPPAFAAGERPTLAGDPRPADRPMPQDAPQPKVMAPPPASPSASQPATSQSPVPPPASPLPAATQRPQAPQASPPQTSRVQPAPTVAGSQFSLTPVGAGGTQQGIVSGQAASAAAAAFDRLAQAALQQSQPPAAPPQAPRAPSPTVGGRALEDMVAEMLKPMLRQWMDANLPAIVERLVQQEIQKMSKR
ncbi:MAG: DUF2497 domain-containing protein, partial [Reyranellaceae bacterium]